MSAPIVYVVSIGTGATVRTRGAGVNSLDLGHLAWAPKALAPGVNHNKDRNGFTISTTIGLGLQCPAADSGRRALIAASVQRTDARYSVALDGMSLSTGPVVISAASACGSITEHTLELRVPVSAADGPIDPNISFEVSLR